MIIVSRRRKISFIYFFTNVSTKYAFNKYISSQNESKWCGPPNWMQFMIIFVPCYIPVSNLLHIGLRVFLPISAVSKLLISTNFSYDGDILILHINNRIIKTKVT